MTWHDIIVKDVAYSQKISLLSHKPVFRGTAWVFARSGDSWVWFVISILFLWKWPQFGWLLLATVALTALLTAVVKGLFKRERPTPKKAFSTDKYAFPSGHAARAGAVAVTLSLTFPSWTILFFLWASLVCFSRVALSRHFVSDVIGGFLFGVLVSLVLQIFL